MCPECFDLSVHLRLVFYSEESQGTFALFIHHSTAFSPTQSTLLFSLKGVTMSAIGYNRKGPLYQQLMVKIKGDILKDNLVPGTKLPSQNEMMRMYGLSCTTVKKALSQLVGEGVLIRKQGLGTFVTRPVKEKLIGVIVPDLIKSICTHIVRGAEDHAHTLDYRILVGNDDHLFEKFSDYVQSFQERKVSGFLICPLSDRYGEVVSELVDNGISVVFYDIHLPWLDVDCVTTDNHNGGKVLTEHLLSLGYEDIVFLHERLCSTVADRIEGYREAMRTNGLADNIVEVGTPLTKEEAGHDLVDTMLKKQLTPDAVLTSCDSVAVGVMNALHKKKINVPEDVAVVGYDNDYYGSGEQFMVPLTTMAQPVRKMGEEAMRLLIERIEGRTERKEVVLKSNLIVRESCGVDIRKDTVQTKV